MRKRVAPVLREHQEGAGIRNEAAVQGDAVGDRVHRELAHPEVDVARIAVLAGQHPGAAPLREVRSREIGGAADQLRQHRAERLQRVLGCLARRDVLGRGTRRLDVPRAALRPVLGQLRRHPSLELRRLPRVVRTPGLEPRPPFAVAGGAALAGVPARVDVARDFEGRVGPVERFPRSRDLVVAERRAVRGRLARLARRPEPDDGLAAQDRRAIGDRERLADRGVDRVGVVTVHAAHHVPAVGVEAGRGVVGEPPPDLAVDGDVVVVVERDQLAETQRAGERARLVRDPFHQAAVAHEHPGAVVDDGVPVAVEARREDLLRNGHAHGVRESLAERPGGRLDPGRVAVFGVAGGHRVELAEAPQLVERERVAAQVEQGVEEHRAVPVGEHETVPVRPRGIGRIVLQVVVPEHLGDVRHPHRHAGMAGLRTLHRVHGQRADRVGELSA